MTRRNPTYKCKITVFRYGYRLADEPKTRAADRWWDHTWRALGILTHILNVRVTFHTMPMHVLERYTIADKDAAYAAFEESGIDECVIVQTCNRVEMFCKCSEPDYTKITDAWAKITGLPSRDFECVQTDQDAAAMHHLLKLAVGLDSMVVGEEQVLGQIKESISQARAAKASGIHLNTLFDRAIRLGTKIRNSTGIGRGGVSVGSMAVKLAEESINDIKDKNILIIGTGEVATLVAKSLVRRGYDFSAASRTLRRAAAFCSKMGGTPVEFRGVLKNFNMYDVLFVATTAPFFLVAYDAVSSLPRKDGGMMILDLSNPRAVDERIANIYGIKMMNLDQIGEMVERNIKERNNKVDIIESIIKEEVPALEASMHRLEAEPLVNEVFRRMGNVCDRELVRALQMLGDADERTTKIVSDMSRAILESLASTPMNNIRHASERGDKETVEAASKIFDYS